MACERGQVKFTLLFDSDIEGNAIDGHVLRVCSSALCARPVPIARFLVLQKLLNPFIFQA